MTDPDYDLLNSQSRALLCDESDALAVEKLCATICELQSTRDQLI